MFMGILKTSERSETWNKGSMGHFFTIFMLGFFYDPHASNYAPSCPRYEQFGNLPQDDGRNFAHECQKRNPIIKFVENNPKIPCSKI